MSLTNNSDVMGRFHESAFNKILNEILLQRPSLFNYGTEKVINENRFCSPISINPILESMGIEKSTKVDRLPIIGSDSSSNGVDYCVQLKELVLDFNPSSEIQLPSELGNLALQQFAIKGTICAGLGCNHIGFDLPNLGNVSHPIKNKRAKKITSGLTFFPLEYLKMHCFCLSIYGKAVVVREGNFIKLRLVGIELEQISPLGLENSIECYLKQMLDYGIFPKIKIALEDLAFNVESYFSVGLTPTSAALPYNPDVSNNYLSIFLNIN